MRHHDETIARLVAAAPSRPDWRAVILTGSVAKGTEREDSDVDACVVVDEQVFDVAFAAGRVAFVEFDLATYDGGYLDLKLTTLEQLRLAAERGDEPVRAAYLGARVVWARDAAAVPELERLLAAVTVLPEHEWELRQRSAIAFFRLHAHYFAGHALNVGDPYLLRHAAVHAVSGASRALLALNHVLFAGNKYVSETVPALPVVPPQWRELSTALLERPGRETLDAFIAMVEGVREWGMDENETDGRYIADNELAWLTGVPPSEYR